MSMQIADRMTVGWYGEHEVATADLIRRAIGPRNLNRKVKEILTEWLRKHQNGRTSLRR